MNDEPSALVGSFRTMLRQLGCRSFAVHAQRSDGANVFARRELSQIETGAGALPGDWQVDTTEGETGGVARAWLRPLGSSKLPTYVFDRRDGFFTVRRNRIDESGRVGSLVFGVFTSVMVALDAIHNDVLDRQVHGEQMALC